MSPGLSAAGLFSLYHTHWHFGIVHWHAAGARGRSATGACLLASSAHAPATFADPHWDFLVWPLWHLAFATLLGIFLLASFGICSGNFRPLSLAPLPFFLGGFAPRFRDPLWDFSFGPLWNMLRQLSSFELGTVAFLSGRLYPVFRDPFWKYSPFISS